MTTKKEVSSAKGIATAIECVRYLEGTVKKITLKGTWKDSNGEPVDMSGFEEVRFIKSHGDRIHLVPQDRVDEVRGKVLTQDDLEEKFPASERVKIEPANPSKKVKQLCEEMNLDPDDETNRENVKQLADFDFVPGKAIIKAEV